MTIQEAVAEDSHQGSITGGMRVERLWMEGGACHEDVGPMPVQITVGEDSEPPMFVQGALFRTIPKDLSLKAQLGLASKT